MLRSLANRTIRAVRPNQGLILTNCYSQRSSHLGRVNSRVPKPNYFSPNPVGDCLQPNKATPSQLPFRNSSFVSSLNYRRYSAVSNLNYQSKKVTDWSVNDVAEWAATELKFDDETVDILRKEKVTGRVLLAIKNRDDFVSFFKIAKGPAEQLWNAITELDSDVYESLKKLADKCQLKSTAKTAMFQFPDYVREDRMGSVRELLETLLDKNFKAWVIGQRDKQMWWSYVIHGASGVGKTRFCQELTKLMKDCLSEQTDSPLALKLKDALENVKVLYMNIGSNGEQITQNEFQQLSPSVMLGIRVAHKYWFPNIIFDEFVDKIIKLPGANDKFTLAKVLRHLLQEPNAPRMLHLIFDEFQTKSGPEWKQQQGTDSLIKNLNRELMNATASITINTNTNTFVFSTFCGTGYSSGQLDLDLTLYPTKKILLPLMSTPSMMKISDQITYKIDDTKVTGADWHSDKFSKLLKKLGGLPRAVEALKDALARNKRNPSSDAPFDVIYGQVQSLLQERVSFTTWATTAEYLPYVALSGYPIMNTWKFNAKETLSFREMELNGLIQLQPVWTTDVEEPTKKKQTGQFIVNLPSLFVTDILAQKLPYLSIGDYGSQICDIINNVKITKIDEDTFEDLTNLTLALRFNVGYAMSTLNRAMYIQADNFWHSVYCHESFLKMGDLPIEPKGLKIYLSRARKKWLYEKDLMDPQLTIPDLIEDDNGNKHSITDFTQPELICIGGQNIYDGLLKLTNTAHQRIMVWIDAKFTMDDNSLSTGVVERLIKKRESVAQKLPDYQHYLLIVSNNKMMTETGPSKSLKLILNTPNTAVICAENLDTALSSAIAEFMK